MNQGIQPLQELAKMGTISNQLYKTGELLIKEGLVRDDDIQTALAIQEKRKASVSLNKTRLLGMILCDLNLITPLDNYVILSKHNKLITLSSSLVEKGVVSLEQMQGFEAQSLREDLPLISMLLKANAVSMQSLQQILFDLFHIPLRSISDFIFRDEDRSPLTRIIDRQVSKENGIIPLVLKDNTVLFGVTAPENLLLIHQLNQQFPQYRFKTLFITFSGFAWFHEIIYNGGAKKKAAESPAEKEKQPDVSLILAYKTLISDPRAEWSAVQTLYNQYETIRTRLGNSEILDRQSEFSSFIQHAHRRVSKRSRTRHIEFSFKKQGKGVIIVATPKVS